MGRRDRFRRILRPLTALAGVTGAAALVNHRLREASMLPQDHLGGAHLPWTWNEHEIFACELGQGPPLLLIHGLHPGASSFEFRRLAPLLATTHRVIAFDLLGCGLSAMPDIAYSPERFVEQILDVIAAFTDEPLALVGGGLGATLAIQAATRAADRVRRVVAICPTGLGGVLDDEQATTRLPLAALLRAPLLGESAFNAMAAMGAIRRRLEHELYADSTSVTREIVEHYHAVLHQAGARFVPAHLLGGLLNCNVARDLPFLAMPLLVLWGERAPHANPLSKAAEYVRLANDGRLVTLPRSGLLPHEEEPEATAAAISAFLLPQGARSA